MYYHEVIKSTAINTIRNFSGWFEQMQKNKKEDLIKLWNNVQITIVVIVYWIHMFLISLDHCSRDLRHQDKVYLDDE